MTARRLLAAALPLLVSACAVMPPGHQVVAEGKQALDAAPLCCRDLSTASRQPLPIKAEPTPVKIDKTAPAFDFGGNKAFFVLYELPAWERAYEVVLVSQAAGPLNDAALFIPRIAMYDADFKVTRYFDEKSLRNRGNNLERSVFVNPGDARERYMAVYGSDLSASIERAYSMQTVTPIVTPFGTWNYASGVDAKSTLRASPVGELELTVKGLAPAAK